MSWQYRVYKAEGCYTIREHHDTDSIVGYTEPVKPEAFEDESEDPILSLRWQLEMMLKALDEPVIEVTKVIKAY